MLNIKIVMRNINEYNNFLQLKLSGITNTKISKILNIPRTTLNDWEIKGFKSKEQRIFKHFDDDVWVKSYNYILGQYLGDGYIVKIGRVYCLKIYCDAKYKELNDYIFKTLKIIFPSNSIMRNHYQNHIITYVYSNTIPELFPQLGSGLKKNRKIELFEWQKLIIDYKYLLAGLLHSDGSFYFDREYEMCNFTNTSYDILDIFKECCKNIELKFTVTKNKIHIRNRKDVKWIIDNIGDKIIIKI